MLGNFCEDLPCGEDQVHIFDVSAQATTTRRPYLMLQLLSLLENEKVKSSGSVKFLQVASFVGVRHGDGWAPA